MTEETAYVRYLRLREDWHLVVMAREKADRNIKPFAFERLARAWAQLTKSERSCAGKHAALMFHELERSGR